LVIDSIPQVVGMAYAIIATLLIVILLRKGKFSRRKGYILLIVSTLFGFLVFAPMLPLQLQTIIMGNVKQIEAPLPLAIVVLVVFIVLAFAFGRSFCGHVCPIGTVQELIYLLPSKKLKISNKAITIAFRLLFSIAFVILAAAFSIGLLKYLGVKDFFHLDTASVFFWAFLAIAVISIFLYRPFCRLACPYGVLLSLAVIKGRFKLRRNENCINCKKCIEACPTNEVGWTDLKQECYMCYRCKEICPVDGMEYTRRYISEQERKKVVGTTPKPGTPAGESADS
jgi:ferredoxin-type protein NapH